VFTNLGEAHQANFESYEEKAAEKLTLFQDVRKLIYPADYPALSATLEQQKQQGYFQDPDFESWSWTLSQNPSAARFAFSQNQTDQNVTLKAEHADGYLVLPFSDQASVENAANSWLTTQALGYQPAALQERFRHLTTVAMRLELKKGVNRCTLINDAYNADLASLRIALDELKRQQQHPKHTLILSDLLESSANEESLYEAVGDLIQEQVPDRIIGIGPALKRQQHRLPTAIDVYENTAGFLSDLPSYAFADEAILLKGSRQFGFEQISLELEQASHRTVLEVNLNALAQNLNAYRRRLKPGVQTMVMVKAFSYGSGTYEVANLLAHHRVSYLAVAYADEGVELRKAGVELPIMVLNPEARAFPDILAYQLEPEIYSVAHLQQLQEVVEQEQPEYPVSLHLMLDTGMHRLGVEADDLPPFLQAFQNTPYLQLASVFSHLAASDDPSEDAFTQSQIAQFDRMAQMVRETVGYPVPRHILNTNGVLRFPEAQYEMVRLGIGFYGVDRTGLLNSELAIPATLTTQISQIKQLKPGDTVGYGRKGQIHKPTTIATLAIGYADGFSRLLSNGQGYVSIHGYKAPVIGDVCMDMTMVNVTGIPAQEGDQAVVFGQDPTIEEMARLSGTIPYEILTSVSQRVKRVYYHE
jgi:alanine racemase